MSDILKVKVNNEWQSIPAIKGDNGEGVPEGGTTGQVLKKKTNTDYDTEWGTVDALPSQSGQSGKYLTTNGTQASWGTIDLSSKQDTLVSGTNIKTINSNSILGSGNLDIDGLPSQTGQSGKYLTTNGTNASWGSVSSYHPDIFSHQWCDHLLNNISWLRADTFSWQSGSVYVTAYNELVSEYNNASSTTETEGSITFKRTPKGYKIADSTQETAILNKYNTDGISWYYILDTANTRFKLPRTKFGFEGLRDTVGNDVGESLPNIKGTAPTDGHTLGTGSAYLTGAMYSVDMSYEGRSSSTVTQIEGLGFDASRSSSTYQDNAPVQERATQMYLYFYVGEYAQTAIEQTAGITSEQLNAKVDVASLSTINPMITSYVNGTSGYNIWANGYCEQWGFTGAMEDYATATITFVKTFANTNYIIQGNTIWQGTNDDTTWMQAWKIQQNSLETTGFSFYNRSATKKVFRWKVCGYLAEGEY